jgi:hypothetical protein
MWGLGMRAYTPLSSLSHKWALLHKCCHPESPRPAARCAKHRKRTLFTASPLSHLWERGGGEGVSVLNKGLKTFLIYIVQLRIHGNFVTILIPINLTLLLRK